MEVPNSSPGGDLPTQKAQQDQTNNKIEKTLVENLSSNYKMLPQKSSKNRRRRGTFTQDQLQTMNYPRKSAMFNYDSASPINLTSSEFFEHIETMSRETDQMVSNLGPMSSDFSAMMDITDFQPAAKITKKQNYSNSFHPEAKHNISAPAINKLIKSEIPAQISKPIKKEIPESKCSE